MPGQASPRPYRFELRDVLVAAPSRTQAGAFEVRQWSSAGPTQAFVRRALVASAAGIVTTIERDDRAGGDVFIAADLLPRGSSGSVVYGFVSPFLVGLRRNFDPPRESYRVESPEVITDFKIDSPNATDPNRSHTLVVVGRDTVTGANWLRRVSLSGRLIAGVWLGSTAQRPCVALDPVGGDIYVVDNLGFVQHLDSSLSLSSASPTVPAISFTDVMWDDVATPGNPLVASGRCASPAMDGMFRLSLGTNFTATTIATLPATVRGISVDAAGDGYCLVDRGGAHGELWRWEAQAGAVSATNLPVDDYQAMTWSSRCSVEGIGHSPGTPIGSLLVPPMVGDRGLTYLLLPPSGMTLGPMAILIASRFVELGPWIGPDARLVVDPTAPDLFVLPLPGATAPMVQVPMPLLRTYNGVHAVSQFVALDTAANQIVTSSASNFVIGLRPVD